MTKDRGFVWSILAVALIVLLGAVSYMFVYTAGNAYGRITQGQEDEYCLRVAANYITTRVRQSDAAGGLSVISSPFGDCLVLSEEIGGEAYETRVYFHDGYLRESFVPAGSDYNEDTAFELVELDGFGVSFEGGVIRAVFSAGGETRTVTVASMSEGGRL